MNINLFLTCPSYEGILVSKRDGREKKEPDTLVFECGAVVYFFCFHDVGILSTQISGAQGKERIECYHF